MEGLQNNARDGFNLTRSRYCCTLSISFLSSTIIPSFFWCLYCWVIAVFFFPQASVVAVCFRLGVFEVEWPITYCWSFSWRFVSLCTLFAQLLWIFWLLKILLLFFAALFCISFAFVRLKRFQFIVFLLIIFSFSLWRCFFSLHFCRFAYWFVTLLTILLTSLCSHCLKLKQTNEHT